MITPKVISTFFLLCSCVVFSTRALCWETTNIFAPTTGEMKPEGVALSSTKINSSSQIIYPYPDGSTVLLGEGFDFIRGERKEAYCVDVGTRDIIKYNDRKASFEEVSDEYSLQKKINMSVSASAKYGAYSADASYNSSLSTTVSTKNLNVVAKISVLSHAHAMKPSFNPTIDRDDLPIRRIDINGRAKKLLANARDFRRVCGDGYVSEIVYGSDLYGIYTFENLSYENRLDISKSLDVSAGGGFSAKISEKINQVVENENVATSIRLIERGAGRADLPANHSDFIEYYKKFSRTTIDNERPLYVVVKPYGNLPSGENADQLSFSSYLTYNTQKLLRLRTVLRDTQDAITQLLGGMKQDYLSLPNIDSVTGTRNLTGLRKRLQELKIDIGKVEDNLRKCLNSSEPEADCRTQQSQGEKEAVILSHKFNGESQSIDLAYRAIGPVPKNIFSQWQINGFEYFSEAEDLFRDAVACNVSAGIFRELIWKAAAQRCLDGDCIKDRDMEELLILTYDSYDVGMNFCSRNSEENSFPHYKITSKSRAFEIPKGRSYSIKLVTNAGGNPSFDALLRCGDGRAGFAIKRTPAKVYERRTKVREIRFPAMNDNCILIIEGYNGKKVVGLQRSDPKISVSNDKIKYTLSFEDMWAPQGNDWNDMVFTIEVDRNSSVPVDEFWQISSGDE